MIQKKIAKIFVLTDLLLNELEVEDKVPTKETKVIKDKAKELLIVLEPVLNRFYNNKEVQKSVFFLTLQRKFNYIFDKEYK